MPEGPHGPFLHDAGGSEMNEERGSVDAALRKMRAKQRPRPYLFYGDALAGVQCEPVRQFPGIVDLVGLFAVLEQCWCKETAYPQCQAEWTPEDPSYGQCAITAMLVADMFGATIHKIRVAGGSTHWFNRLEGQYVDLTSEQIDLYDIPMRYEAGKEAPRASCGRSGHTRTRYRLLQSRMMRYLGTGRRAT